MILIRIKNLRVSTFIGFNPEELVHQQVVAVNLEIKVDVPENAMIKDEPEEIYDYRTITKKVIAFIEQGHFKLLEVLTQKVLNLIMEDPLVHQARVEIDKPGALRFTDSVSVTMEASK